jgi:hypothetical protein
MRLFILPLPSEKSGLPALEGPAVPLIRKDALPATVAQRIYAITLSCLPERRRSEDERSYLASSGRNGVVCAR